MSLLRMLAFRPADDGSVQADRNPARTEPAPRRPAAPAVAPAARSTAAATAAAAVADRDQRDRIEPARDQRDRLEPARGAAETPVARAPVPAPAPVASPTPESGGGASGGIADAEAWHALIAASGLKGPARLLAEHASFIAYEGGVLRLSLPTSDDHLKSSALTAMVANALVPALGATPQIRFENAPVQGESLRERNERARDERQSTAESTFMNDPDVQRLIAQHGAKVVPDSIRPFEDN